MAGKRATAKKAAEAIEEDGVPAFTIRANSDFGIRAMIFIDRMAASDYPDMKTETAQAARDFEIYEETNRE